MMDLAMQVSRVGYTAGYRNFRNVGRHLPEALETRVSHGYLGECHTLSAILTFVSDRYQPS